MKRSVLCMAIALLGIIGSVWGQTDLKEFIGDQLPEGEASYVISDEAGLRKLAELTNRNENNTAGKVFMLTNDIVLMGSWVPIGNDSFYFQGSFDGGNHSISGLKTEGEYEYTGLFGIIRTQSSSIYIKDLTLAQDNGSKIKGYSGEEDWFFPCTGALAGKVEAGGYVVGEKTKVEITNCHNMIPVSGEQGLVSSIGGIIGYVNVSSGPDYNKEGETIATLIISGCSNSGIIMGGEAEDSSYSGGIIGYVNVVAQAYFSSGHNQKNSSSCMISECTNTGTVIGGNSTYASYAGGIIANAQIQNANMNNSRVSHNTLLIIDKCSNNGDITAGEESLFSSSVGGIMGKIEYWSDELSTCLFKLSDSYSYATLKASDGYAGGLVGYLFSGDSDDCLISNCYAAGTIAGSASSAGGLIGLMGKYAHVSSFNLTLENCLAVMAKMESGSNASLHRIIGMIGNSDDDGETFTDVVADCFGEGNYAQLVKGTQPEGNLTGLEGADWEWDGTTMNILEDLPVWKSDTWNIYANHLPQLKATGSIVHPEVPYPFWSDDPDPAPSTYHTLTLESFPGIDLYNLSAGTHQLEEGGHLHLQFLPEDHSLTANDLMLLIDGVDTPFNDFGNGNYFSYILNPISADHTIEIAQREYTVTLPETEGVTFDIGAGEHRAAFGKAFAFTLTLAEGIDPEKVSLSINGIAINPVATGINTLTYHIDQITGPVAITVEGTGNPTGNSPLTTSHFQLSTFHSQLIIEADQPQSVRIFNLSGVLQKVVTVKGRETVALDAGVYLVQTGHKVYKVIVN